MMQFDVAVVGAGLAGLVCAKNLARRGLEVVLLDRKADVTRGVHTTGIFVRKTLEDFEFPERTLGPPIRGVTLYSPGGRSLHLASERDEFRVGRMAELYRGQLEDGLRAGVSFLPETRFIGTERGTLYTDRRGVEGKLRARYVVGADGAVSRVAAALRLSENRDWIVAVEEVYRAPRGSRRPGLHCFFDPRLAPGYLAWVVDDGEEFHIGVGGYGRLYQPRRALEQFKKAIPASLLAAGAGGVVERRGGRIPVGGLLPRIVSHRGLLLGDASGAVSPLTAGGLDPCLRQTRYAVEVIADYLEHGDPSRLGRYQDARLRAKFRTRRTMRRLFATVPPVWAVEAGFRLLRLPGIRAFAEGLFFGRGSFPDPEELLSGPEAGYRKACSGELS